MNEKRVKLIRRLIRGDGRDPTDVQYRRHKHKGIIFLDPKCGRAFYQSTKRTFKNHHA